MEEYKTSYAEEHDLEASKALLVRSARGSGQSGECDADTIFRLVHAMHEKSSEAGSLLLQLNHVQLQVQTLCSLEQQARSERDAATYALAKSEQDKLLLETKLQEVAGFEGAGSMSIDDVRGMLLTISNEKISELAEQVRKLTHELEDGQTQHEQETIKVDTKNKALEQEIKRMSELLAQRTVLYSAQQRRWQDSSRANDSLQHEQSTENVQLRARLQQLEQQFEQTDRARIEAVLSSRQLEESTKRAQEELAEALERTQTLDSDLAEATAQNISLQAAVDRLRGADIHELERDLTKEVETIRAEGKARDDILKRQLEDARERLAGEAERREALIDEVARLRRELSEQTLLLRAVSNGGMMSVPGGIDHLSSAAFASASGIYPSSSSARNLDDEDDEQVEREHEDEDICASAAEVDNSVFAAMFDGLEELGEMMANDTEISQQTRRSPAAGGDGNSNSFFDRSSRSNRYLDEDEEEEDFDYDTEFIPATSPSVADTNTAATAAAAATKAVASTLVEIRLLIDKVMADSRIRDDLLKALARLSTNASQSTSDDEDAQSATKTLLSLASSSNSTDLETFFGSPNHDAALKALMSEAADALSHILLVASEQTSVNTPLSLSDDFLTGSSSVPGNKENHQQQQQQQHLAVNFAADVAMREELDCLKEELVKRKRTEVRLSAALKEQGAKLALVLQRASQMPPMSASAFSSSSSSPSSSSSSSIVSRSLDTNAIGSHVLIEHENTIACLRAEHSTMRQQIENYREELTCLEQQALTSRALGAHEAAETYSERVRLLEEELLATRHDAKTKKTLLLVDAATDTAAPVYTQHSSSSSSSSSASHPLQAALAENLRDLQQLQEKLGGWRSKRSSNFSGKDDSSNGKSVLAEQHLMRLGDVEASSHRDAEAWAVERSGLKKQLEEATIALREASAVAVIANDSGINAKEMHELRLEFAARVVEMEKAHEAKVEELVSRLHEEHTQELRVSTECMQKQLHRLIASLRQDHEEELRVKTALLEEAQQQQQLQLQLQQLQQQQHQQQQMGQGNTSVSMCSVGCNTVDELVVFADVQEDRNASLQRLRLSLEREHQLDLAEKISTLHREFEAQLSRNRKQIVATCRAQLEKQAVDLLNEREEIVAQVKQECMELLRAGYAQEQKSEHETLVVASNKSGMYPEMLSPQTTTNLIRNIASRTSLNSLSESDSFSGEWHRVLSPSTDEADTMYEEQVSSDTSRSANERTVEAASSSSSSSISLNDSSLNTTHASISPPRWQAPVRSTNSSANSSTPTEKSRTSALQRRKKTQPVLQQLQRTPSGMSPLMKKSATNNFSSKTNVSNRIRSFPLGE